MRLILVILACAAAFESNTPQNDAKAQDLNRNACAPHLLHVDRLDDIAAVVQVLHTCGAVFLAPEVVLAGMGLTDGALREMRDAALEVLASGVTNVEGRLRNARVSAVPEKHEAIDPVARTNRLLLASPVGDLIRAYFAGTLPRLAYTQVWYAPPGVAAQEVHTDSRLRDEALGLMLLLDDLGDAPDCANGEFAQFPGCFDPDGESTNGPEGGQEHGASHWCEQVQDQEVGAAAQQALQRTQGLRRVLQGRRAGSFLLYDQNTLHAGCANRSGKTKVALEWHVYGRATAIAKDDNNSPLLRVAYQFGGLNHLASAGQERDEARSAHATAAQERYVESWEGVVADLDRAAARGRGEEQEEQHASREHSASDDEL